MNNAQQQYAIPCDVDDPARLGEGLYVSLYPDQIVRPQLTFKHLDPARGTRLFVFTVAPDIELALVHRMLLIARRSFDRPNSPRPEGQDRAMRTGVSIGFVNHDDEGEGIEPRFWTLPFTTDLLSRLDVEMKAWWASLPPARRPGLSESFDDDPSISWQDSPQPANAGVKQSAANAAMKVGKQASKKRAKKKQ
jgi:hypothetical protein